MHTIVVPIALRWNVPDGDVIDWLTGFVLSPTLPQMVVPHSILFMYRGKWGVPLSGDHDVEHLQDSDDPVFEDCGTRITYKVSIEGYPVFTHQKYARKQVKGQKVSITRAKVVDQICDVMRIFIETASTEDINRNLTITTPEGSALRSLSFLSCVG